MVGVGVLGVFGVAAAGALDITESALLPFATWLFAIS